MTLSRYEKLKELLAKETYPHSFPYKLIGKNTPLFLAGIKSLELKHPELVLHSQKESKNKNHLSYTYLLEANSSESIIAIFLEIEKIPDLTVIL
jgi:putative lipoic acid-binding regulatory protein